MKEIPCGTWGCALAVWGACPLPPRLSSISMCTSVAPAVPYLLTRLAGCSVGRGNQGCQFRFGRCFVFSIGMECFSFGVFQGCTIYIYIYKTNIIQIQDKLIINYAIQTQCQTNIILKFKIFLNSQD